MRIFGLHFLILPSLIDRAVWRTRVISEEYAVWEYGALKPPRLISMYGTMKDAHAHILTDLTDLTHLRSVQKVHIVFALGKAVHTSEFLPRASSMPHGS
jgi:hypothetical protein